MVSTYAWQACYIRCKNLALNIRESVSLMGRGSSVVGASLRNYGKFVFPTLLCLLDETLTGVYARGSKRSHTGGKCVTCHELHILA